MATIITIIALIVSNLYFIGLWLKHIGFFNEPVNNNPVRFKYVGYPTCEDLQRFSAAQAPHKVLITDLVVEKSNRDWPEDASLEGGNSVNICMTCNQKFIGHNCRACCKGCHQSELFSTGTGPL